ncbi:MAG: efflux RND transporter permease subunit [Deltaproteobacteria bacterium]|nr:efflux RND transporter permease subunit [Deltaproteobacteria bacterium]
MKEYFFLRRPILAAVIAAVILLAGGLGLRSLPVTQYPDLVPPSVTVSAFFPGAGPEAIADLVAAPLEEALNGLEDVWYMRSTSSASGRMELTVTFKLGVEQETAANRVNLKVQSCLAGLPEEARRLGVNVISGGGAFLQIVVLASPDGRYDSLFLNNYASANVIDALKRIPGVADASPLIAEEYAMRIWYDPGRLAALGLMPMDLASAVREQNAQYAAGSLGLEPAPAGAGMTWLTSAGGRFDSAEDFADIIVRTGEAGQFVRLGDVAKVELGAADYGVRSRLNGQPVAGVGISLAGGANALQTAADIRSTMEELARDFPVGVEFDIPYDVTVFVKLSIQEVAKTLFEAMVLVVLVIFLFLRNFRATVIPCAAAPIAIVGSFCGMWLLGFSINLLTLFGMVLSIGIVVDDAIVVLENAERLMHEEGLDPQKAAGQAMREVAGPVMAIVLVLAAVFIPVSCLGGLAGEMFRQFGVTIALSAAISGVTALTLTPVMCAKLLRPKKAPGAFFRAMDLGFGKLTNFYMRLVKYFLKRPIWAFGCLILVMAGSVWLFKSVPEGLTPEEDQGYVIAAAILPEGASMPRTDATLEGLRQALSQNPDVDKILSIAGQDILSGAGALGNYGVAFVMLKPWEERRRLDQSSFAVVGQIFGQNSALPDGLVAAFNPPSIVGMGSVGGLEGFLQNRGGASLAEIAASGDILTRAAVELPELAGVSCSLSLSAPTVKAVLDVDKAKLMGVSPADVYSALSVGLSGSYINDFVMNGRVYKVVMQSESRFRAWPEDLDNFFVRARDGGMIALANLVTANVEAGPVSLTRFNGLPSARLSAQAAPGYSNLQAMEALERLVRENLSSDYDIGWSGASYQEKVDGGANFAVLILALALVFMILAVQHESLILPVAALLAVPFAVFGALLTIFVTGRANDVYVQVALVTLIGLSVKNAILIVEFAWAECKDGGDAVAAAASAAAMRFRPIVMTSMAFILGCLPLAMSSGAGSASRNVLGSSIIGGMLAATLVAPLFIPAFFAAAMKFAKKRTPKNGADGGAGGGKAGEDLKCLKTSEENPGQST